MGDLQYPRPMRIMYKNSPSLQSFFDSPLHNVARSQTSNSNNSANLKPNLKKKLGYESGPKMDTCDEKNQSSKISRYCTFKGQ
jgi:hypothetical protein